MNNEETLIFGHLVRIVLIILDLYVAYLDVSHGLYILGIFIVACGVILIIAEILTIMGK